MSDTTHRDADAIRYAVLRKLASGMRHTLMGELQTIQFSAELAAKMLGSGATSPKLKESIRQLPAQTRVAVATCRAVMEWLRPDDKATTAVGDAVQQCLKVAGDDWVLRGIESSTDVQSGDAKVSKALLRELCVTSLLALTDSNPGPIDIAISSTTAGAEVVLSLSARQVARKSPFPPLTLYRSLSCDDVMAVAKADGVSCSCAEGTITLRLPIVSAPA